jgi:ribonuclease R
LKLGAGGLTDAEGADLEATSMLISQAERRAMAAERDTVDRLIAAHLADRIGASFPARISGVTKAGLFVRLRDTGADGFIPISTLGNEYFRYVETAHAVLGERSGLSFRLGDDVTVKLVEALPMAGALRFEMISEGSKGLADPGRGGGRGIRAQRRLGAKSRRRR